MIDRTAVAPLHNIARALDTLRHVLDAQAGADMPLEVARAFFDAACAAQAYARTADRVLFEPPGRVIIRGRA